MDQSHVWWLWIALSSAAAFMTVVVRITAWKERWIGSSWVIVYLACALVIGVLWILTRR